MFEHLKQHKKILVSGPQRSGTRICSFMVSADTEIERIDEVKAPNLFVAGQELAYVKSLVQERDEFVLHCPPFSRWLHEVSGVAVVLMRRATTDIIKSERRINWRKDRQELEYAKYGYWRWRRKPGLERTFKPISEIKYEYWDNVQKEQTEYAFEVNYDDLMQHPLWVPPEKRKNFSWSQISNETSSS